jgi:molybdopterin converting factor small subunit
VCLTEHQSKVALRIQVSLFAGVKAAAGTTSVEVDLDAADLTVGAVRRALAERFPLAAELIGRSLFAVGTDYATDDRVLLPGDDLACIPPVSGG